MMAKQGSRSGKPNGGGGGARSRGPRTNDRRSSGGKPGGTRGGVKRGVAGGKKSDGARSGRRGSGGSKRGPADAGVRGGSSKPAGRLESGGSFSESEPPESSLPRADRLADAVADAARERSRGGRSERSDRGGHASPPSGANKNFRARGGASPGPHRKPPMRIFTTTLWSYPSQHYGDQVQGDKNYIGATPGWVIWQVLKRYSSPGDVVIDPMAGSGTTIDVAKDLARETRAFDLAPTRDDIERADARELPVDDEAADVMFIDPPYSTHVDYSDDPACIGKLDALVKANEDPALNPYYAAMTQVIIEAKRVLKPGGTLALYVSDSYRKGKPFMPIGFELFSIMRGRGMTPVDIVAVARGNEKLGRGNFHKAAEEQNFFLRGFNYLLIMQKQAMDVPASKENARSGTKKGTSPAQRGARSSGPPRRVAGRKAAVGGIDAGPKGGARKAPKASGGAKPKRPSNKPNRGPLGPKTRNTKPGQRRNKPGGKL